MGGSGPRDGDRLVGFTLPNRGARGRIVRLDGVLREILAAHAYPDRIAALLGESLVLTALLGALLRPNEGQLTLQAKGSGGLVKLLVTDCRDGEVRGYVALDLDRRFQSAETLAELFGNGQLVITLDQTLAAERYQGIVALEGERLEDAASAYFAQSEQLPSLVKLASGRGADGEWVAGGMIVQPVSRAETGGARLHVEGGEADWRHVRLLGETLSDAELLDPLLPLQDLLWRLFHEDGVGMLDARVIRRGCRCSEAHIRAVLGQFPEDERAEMRNRDGLISVDCEFCSRQFLLAV